MSSEAVHLSSHALIVGNVSTTFFPIPNSTCKHKTMTSMLHEFGTVKFGTWITRNLLNRAIKPLDVDIEYFIKLHLVQAPRLKIHVLSLSSSKLWHGPAPSVSKREREEGYLFIWFTHREVFMSWCRLNRQEASSELADAPVVVEESEAHDHGESKCNGGSYHGFLLCMSFSTSLKFI